MISLNQFCKDHSLPKTSVYRWLTEQGHPTNNGIESELQDLILEQFCKPEPAPEPAPEVTQDEPVSPTAITVTTGNHCQALTVPAFDGFTVDLAQFRESETLVIDDPLSVAAQFIATAGAIKQALNGDIKAREQRLHETKQAKDAIATAAQQLELEQRLYKLQTSQLDHAQTLESQTLAASLAALQSLGKPAPAGEQ